MFLKGLVGLAESDEGTVIVVCRRTAEIVVERHDLIDVVYVQVASYPYPLYRLYHFALCMEKTYALSICP